MGNCYIFPWDCDKKTKDKNEKNLDKDDNICVKRLLFVHNCSRVKMQNWISKALGQLPEEM